MLRPNPVDGENGGSLSDALGENAELRFDLLPVQRPADVDGRVADADDANDLHQTSRLDVLLEGERDDAGRNCSQGWGKGGGGLTHIELNGVQNTYL